MTRVVRTGSVVGLLLLAGGLATVLMTGRAPGLDVSSAVADELPPMEVWKTPACGCCSVWVEHMEAAGFRVKVNDLNDVTPIKTRLKVPPRVATCHTAVVDGYVVEGHVPAADVRRLLKERPDILGLVVPGMPAGSPGMESPRPEPYDVLALGRDGTLEVYSSHQ